VRAIEYTDALELWVKLPYTFSQIFTVEAEAVKRRYSSRQFQESGYITSQFGSGVNRAEAEMLTGLLISDTLSIPLEDHVITTLSDVTRSLEAGEKLTDLRLFTFNWSRSGNRNRLEAVYQGSSSLSKSNSMEYASPQEFLTKMRGLSVFIINNLVGGDLQGYEGYNLSTATAPAPVPANFTKIDRVVTQGGVPAGGFYVGPVISQREYESVMKQNPSAVKNPAQPVNNVSIKDAMEFCNRMSIRDGLDPAYLIEYTERDMYQRPALQGVTLDNFASGYRLANTGEWRYAGSRIEDMGKFPEYIFDGAFEKAKTGPAGTSNRALFIAKGVAPTQIPVFEVKHLGFSPVIRVVRPIFDYWKYTSGQ
jgi:hypothetical protein